jgi:hypothetical protein
MGSANGKGRKREERRRKPSVRQRSRPHLESLEQRTLLTGNPPWHPTTSNLADAQNGPLALAGQQLVQLYQQYQTYVQGGSGQFTSNLSSLIDIRGTQVGVDVRGFQNFATLHTELQNLGMQIGATDPTGMINEGWLPIAALPQVATLPEVVQIQALYKPAYHVGSASNQSDQALFADQARQQFSVDGTGTKVGVLSDSVSQFAGGLADSIRTGDLPANVQVLTDGAPGSTDEGRAMLEQIHDIAPGASLAFSTAADPNAPGDIGFASGIRALAQVGSQVIVDDISYLDEPFFQDGKISQAINEVVSTDNVTYLSAAGNQANAGYASQWRGVNANVAGVGAGRFMNFNPNPSGTPVTNLPITITQAGQAFVFQWDNPFYTTNGVTSDLDIFILDQNNNVVASGTTNNIATQQPLEVVGLPGPGTYSVVVRSNPGSPDVGHIVFLDPVSNGLTVSQQFGANGGTSYPTTLGHEAAASTIGVGAVPWFDTPPYTTLSTDRSEGFSSFGPETFIFDANGARLATPLVRLAPDVSAPDGNDTSFFIPGLFLSTLNPPPGTGPATTTELDGNKLPNFFGTSSAAPNLASVAAMIKQFNPSSTESDIRNAFIAAANPLNGAARGQWDVQGGFGIVDARAALRAVDLLRVVTATNENNVPLPGANLGSAPNFIVFNFNRAVNFSTVTAADLHVTTQSPGVSITVGTPIQVSDTQIKFPISITSVPGVKANGAYSFTLQSPPNGPQIKSIDGRTLAPFSANFIIDDTIAPRVLSTSFTGRTIQVQFSEGMRTSTLTTANIALVRTGGGNFFTPSNVNLANSPNFRISFDPNTNVMTIDLSSFPQDQLPSDSYGLFITDAVTDVIGNRLDGEFNGPPPGGDNGVFPSGNGQEGGEFIQLLPNLSLQAPQILAVGLDQAVGPPPFTTSDSGIANDQNTQVQNPFIFGHLTNAFPGAIGGVTIAAQFNGLHNGSFDLNVGAGGRGFSGNPDIQTITDSNGDFRFPAPAALPDGFNTVRIIAVGQPDAPPLPGLSTLRDTSFRVSTALPTVTSVLPQFAKIPALQTLTFNFTDPVLPLDLGNPLAVPTQFTVPALNPTTAENLSNYALVNTGPDQTMPDSDDTILSSYIIGAKFTPTTVRNQTSDPYTGTVTLSFAPGLPAGRYVLFIRTTAPGFTGVTDAAGNPLAGDPTNPNAPHDFTLTFDLQSEAAFVTHFVAVSPSQPGDNLPSSVPVERGPRSYYELMQAGSTDERAPAPPNTFFIDFSNPLDPNHDYTPDVLLIRSANSPTLAPDGDFGLDPTFTSGVGYTVVSGTTVTLANSIPGALPGTPGFQNRLIVRIPTGTVLPADDYRVFLPNAVTQTGQDLRMFDVFNNQIDGEFLGNPATGGDYANNLPNFEDLLPNGQMRQGLSGDDVPGGSFETAFIVVPHGNIIYARPDYVDDPFLSSDDPDGSRLKPYPALAPEAVDTGPNGNGGDLNSVANFGTGFNPVFDRNGDGKFERSALYAAQVASARGPVVVIALPGVPQKDSQGNVTQKSFVLQAPAGNDPNVNDGSVSVPAMTDLVFAPGSTLKLLNASLFIQDQGSALQVMGGPNPTDQVTFTSLHDDAAGGPVNGQPADKPALGGDWGGVLLRNFDDTSNGGRPVEIAPGPTYFNSVTTTPLGHSGADDAMSIINFANIRFGGGAVPATTGYRFDAITLFNSRPALTNDVITQNGSANGSQAGISADLDSLREDNLARGPLIRRATVNENSINGILVRPELTGVIQASDALFYPDNPQTVGGAQNYVMFAPLPYVFLARMEIGTKLIHDSGGKTETFTNRLYVQPGSLLKFQRGAGIDVNNTGASINIGDRNYLQQWDLNNNVSPLTPVDPNTPNAVFRDGQFHPENPADAQVVLTSLFDDNAQTFFFDPNTGITTQIVAPIDSDNGGPVNLPTPGNVPPLARWGGVSITSGAIAVINGTTFEFGGGSVNSANGTIPQRDVLAFQFAGGATEYGVTVFPAFGSRAYITNNNFFDNAEAGISVEPDGLLAGDPLRPLNSGNPFIRGNVLLRNDVNGLEVLPFPLFSIGRGTTTSVFGFVPTVDVDSVWENTDITYVLRGTISLNGPFDTFDFPKTDTTRFLPEQKPFMTLTLQSNLPDTLLADGEKIGRPGESLIVKLLNRSGGPPIGDGVNGLPSGNVLSDSRAGAGFLVGVDDGADPPTDPLLDAGAFSQIRITGIGGNETTGQARVPVEITSLRDDSVGTTVRGVKMFQGIFGNTTPPAPGDGGLIAFGANMLTDYNLNDPRDGSIIDNADIRYLTRIEMQGGGLVEDPGTGFWRGIKLGTTAATQLNSYKSMTISNSNLSSFLQVGIIAHPSNVNAIDWSTAGGVTFGGLTRATVRGQGILLYLVNDTITNMPVGVRLNAETTNDDSGQNPTEAVFLNDTFANDPVGIHAEAPAPTNLNHFSQVYFLVMDSIFQGATQGAIQAFGRTGDNLNSMGQYNLFDNSLPVVEQNGGTFDNFQPVNGSALFVNPATGNFMLQPTSDAIDASRSELGPVNWGLSLQPIATQVLDGSTGIRNSTGRTNPAGGIVDFSAPGDIVTLPGYPLRAYKDEWVAAKPGDPGAIPGPTSNPAGVFWYIPITGERDLRGFLRVDDPNRANVGFGSRPFFDVGGYEYRQLFPPHIVGNSMTGLGATTVVTNPASATGTSVVDLYKVGGVAGTNAPPQTITFAFDNQLDPSSITSQTILLQESGGDGVFGNGNSANDKFIDLSGRLSYSSATKTVTIHLGDQGLNLVDDLYRIAIRGDGTNVVHDPEGNALDGENLDANGNQKALPTGDGIPGGNFQLTFSVITTPSSVVPSTLRLDPAVAASTPRGTNITNNNLPSFVGKITDVAPAISPLGGQTVILDYAGPDNVFGTADDRLNAGTALTALDGSFNVKVGADAAATGLVTNTGPLPDTNYAVGADGYLGTNPNTGGFDDSNYSAVRIRVVNTSGNVSNPNDPNALTSFVVDTHGPRVTNTNPLPNSQAVVQAGGNVGVAVVVNQNLDERTVNSSTIRAIRSGGDQIFGNGNDVPLSVTNIGITPLLGSQSGAELLTFTITGVTANDLYQVTLAGAGANAIHDIAGNSLDGSFTGSFPSGSGASGAPGGDFSFPFVVFSPANQHIIYVGQTVLDPAAKQGSRANPFPTIGAGLGAANIGDTVGVLEGIYNEQVTLKSLVRLVSAASGSTDANLVHGNALKTIIRTPATVTGQAYAVRATNTINFPNVQTELEGFSIDNPLQGDPNRGSINPDSIGLNLTNAGVLVDHNYFLTSGNGVVVSTSGAGAPTPDLLENVFVGNDNGVVLLDQASQSFAGQKPTQIVNNDFAFNNLGLVVMANGPQQIVANVGNNIFSDNHTRTLPANGAAIMSSTPNRITLGFNLFSGNGPNPTDSRDDTLNVGSGFDPAVLNNHGGPDPFGNIAGPPGYANPRDPRPQGDGPAFFYFDANFDVTLASAGIDGAFNSFAPPLDFLFRPRVRVTGRGRPGTGPADMGAFEYSGPTTGGGGTGGTGGSGGTGGGGIITHDLVLSGSSPAIPAGIVAPSPSSAQATDAVLASTGSDVGNAARSNGLDFAQQSAAPASTVVPQASTPPTAQTPLAVGHHAHVKHRKGFGWRNLFGGHSARG